MEACTKRTTPTIPDFTGHWSDQNLPGYSINIASLGARRVVLIAAYDGQGQPPWSVGAGQNNITDTMPLKRLQGPCPHCENRNVEFVTTGEITLNFSALNQATINLNIDLENNSPWQRNEATIQILND